MGKYELIIYWKEVGSAFSAEVPALAGCAADGKTYQEALAADPYQDFQEQIFQSSVNNRPSSEPQRGDFDLFRRVSSF